MTQPEQPARQCRAKYRRRNPQAGRKAMTDDLIKPRIILGACRCGKHHDDNCRACVDSYDCNRRHLIEYQERIEAQAAEIARLRGTGSSLVKAIDQMVEDTTPIFAELELVRGRGPYNGKKIGTELEAFRQALQDSKP